MFHFYCRFSCNLCHKSDESKGSWDETDDTVPDPVDIVTTETVPQQMGTSSQAVGRAKPYAELDPSQMDLPSPYEQPAFKKGKKKKRALVQIKGEYENTLALGICDLGSFRSLPDQFAQQEQAYDTL